MPKQRCAVCSSLKTLTREQYLLEHPDLPFLCSVDCLRKIIKGRSYLEPFIMPSDWQILVGSKRYVPSDDSKEHWCGATGESYRSDFERILAMWLCQNGEPFEYEPFTFVVPPTNGSNHEGHYTPDMFLRDRRLLLEPKGVWCSGQKGRIRAMKKLYPEVDLLLVPWRLRGGLLKELYPGTPSKEEECLNYD